MLKRTFDDREIQILQKAKAEALAAEPVEIGKTLFTKYKTVFQCLDSDKDGKIVIDDYITLAERLSKHSGVPVYIANQVKNKMKGFWYDLHGEEAKTGPITAKVYAESILRRGREMVIVSATYFFLLVFDCMDQQGLGVVNVDAFKVFHEMFNVDTSHTAESFGIVDTNKDGLITFTEFIEAGINYFLANDKDSPYNHLFGPLAAE